LLIIIIIFNNSHLQHHLPRERLFYYPPPPAAEKVSLNVVQCHFIHGHGSTILMTYSESSLQTDLIIPVSALRANSELSDSHLIMIKLCARSFMAPETSRNISDCFLQL
jgi:hypothetical protein